MATHGSRPAARSGLLPRHPGVPETIVDGPDEMRRKVRELVRMGADVIKVATSGGVLSPRDKPTHAHFRARGARGPRRGGDGRRASS